MRYLATVIFDDGDVRPPSRPVGEQGLLLQDIVVEGPSLRELKRDDHIKFSADGKTVFARVDRVRPDGSIEAST